MATTVAQLLTQVRDFLKEPVAKFWSDPELTAIMKLGVDDLWGAILDLHGDHYITINDTDVVMKANASMLSGVPDDCFRIQLIEPRDTHVDANGHQLLFTPRKYNHPDFIQARTRSATDPGTIPSREIFYQVTGVGSPVEPPRILVAPALSADFNIRMAYNKTIPLEDVNPIPGQSDNALKAWTIAYAVAKQNESQSPDPGWLSVYATEKQMILVRLTPRQEQEPEVVEDMFQGYGSFY